MPSPDLRYPHYDLLGARLRDLRDAWRAAPDPLAPGDLVRWKPGFQHGDLMGPDDFGVVVAVRDEPTLAEDLSLDRPDYRLPLDVAIGVIDRTDEFCTAWTSRRCLKPATDAGGRVQRLLLDTYACFVRPEPLRVGLLVQWKPFCAPATLARPAMPALVVDLLEGKNAATQEGESTGRGTGQPLDLAVAVEDDECGFRLVWADRRRITAYAGPVAPDPGASGSAKQDGWQGSNEAAASVAARLLDRHRRLLAADPLPSPGTFVRWKPGLRDRILPLDGDAAIVLPLCDALLPEPGFPAGSPLWRQPLTANLGFMGEDGGFAVCLYDARRFEPLPRGSGEAHSFLNQASALYRQRHRFRPGDAIQWKPGLADRGGLSEGQPAVVFQMPAEPPAKCQHPEEPPAPSPSGTQPLLAAFRRDDECVLGEVEQARVRPASPDADAEEILWLRSRLEAFRRPSQMAPGDLVEWKEGWCPLAWSDPEGHGVVIEPAESSGDAGAPEPEAAPNPAHPRFRVGFLDDDGELRIRSVAGCRLQPATPDAGQDDELREIFRRFAAPRAFRPGQIVLWSEGLHGWSFLTLDETSPAIVLRRIDPPVRSSQADPLAEDHNARADLLIGGLDEDGDFAVVPADSRRLYLHPAQQGPAARRLRGFQRRLNQPRNYTPGSLVSWKDRLCAHAGLPYGTPAIVLEQRDTSFPSPPRQPPHTLGSVSFAMSRDTEIGVWTNGQWMRIHCDGRRLEPFDAQIHGAIFQRKAVEEALRMEEFSRMLDDDYDEDDTPF